jgi:hypothetical protein
MQFLGILIFAIQVGFALHVIRSGRDRYWIYLILFLPALGCAIYFFSEVLPELQGNRHVRRAGRAVIKTLDPQREVRRLKDQIQLSDTFENRQALADACVAAGHLDEARQLYHALLQQEEHNPHIMQQLALCQYLEKNYRGAQTTLEDLIRHNPDYKSAEGHLLYAKTLEALGETRQALDEFAVVVETFAGEEARYRYALLLKSVGREEEAHKVFNQILTRARQSPKYYRRAQKQWIELAKQHV